MSGDLYILLACIEKVEDEAGGGEAEGWGGLLVVGGGAGEGEERSGGGLTDPGQVHRFDWFAIIYT